MSRSSGRSTRCGVRGIHGPVRSEEVEAIIDAEQIYEKAKGLDPERLRTLDAFLDFLLARESGEGEESVFALTRLEPPDAPSVYRGPPLTLGQMREGVDAEAGRHR